MILVSGIVHQRPDLILDQVQLYNAAMGGEDCCHHILHVNAEAVRKGLLKQLMLPPNVTINPTHLHTRHPTFMGCHIVNILHAIRAGLPYSHIYLHTDSDIPYRRGLGEHVLAHDFGLAEPIAVTLGQSQSMWAVPVSDDVRLREFVAGKGDGKIYNTRYEGMFATRGIMHEILMQMMAVWPFDENHWRGDYPYEEFALPTVAMAVIRNRVLRRTRHAVVTGPSSTRYKLGSREELNESSIPLLETEPGNVFAAKFAPAALDSPVRKFARAALGVPDPS
ncbi:hypothetical protein [Roseomonas xinghualingensis]|uniref:hypothetical protein n=1 Tax=Roseomonas xinghualingensis TaxID=2986475 RepID=UPI0021F1622D|nr:hypothetical protein [Roseomonas sp. SXEYE001]MCV4207344.1 hypothetical protein [Roseomonas sp. SXEYE001]